MTQSLSNRLIKYLEQQPEDAPVNYTQLMTRIKDLKNDPNLTDEESIQAFLKAYDDQNQVLKAIDQQIINAIKEHQYATIIRLSRIGKQINETIAANQTALQPNESLMYTNNASLVLKIKSLASLYPITYGTLTRTILVHNHQNPLQVHFQKEIHPQKG